MFEVTKKYVALTSNSLNNWATAELADQQVKSELYVKTRNAKRITLATTYQADYAAALTEADNAVTTTAATSAVISALEAKLNLTA